MEFDVILILTLYSEGRAHFSSGYRELKLPFVPFSGLEILSRPIGFGSIRSVSWDEQMKIFRCYLEQESDGIDYDIEFLVQMAKKAGFIGFEKVYDNEENS